MKAVYYPPADQATQNFARRYPGSGLKPNVLVLHTTETGTWPGYSAGATAPHLTAKPDLARKRLLWRQHFPLSMSARALRNEAGGVETNTLNAVQVELIGTCSLVYKKRYGYFYWPDAPDWALEELAKFITWLHVEWESFPIQDAAKRGWLAYPSSYGNTNKQRLTMSEWRNAYGIVGHQHVPENSHGDPGDLKIARLVKFAKPTVTNPAITGSAPEPKQATLVQKARSYLRLARRRSIDHGYTERARRIEQALRELPKS